MGIQTNWTYEHALGKELVRMQGTYFTQLEVAPGNIVWPQMLLYPGALLINRFYLSNGGDLGVMVTSMCDGAR